VAFHLCRAARKERRKKRHDVYLARQRNRTKNAPLPRAKNRTVKERKKRTARRPPGTPGTRYRRPPGTSGTRYHAAHAKTLAATKTRTADLQAGNRLVIAIHSPPYLLRAKREKLPLINDLLVGEIRS
jgi:hypothetical protein